MSIINRGNLKAILSDFKTKVEAKIQEIGKTVPTKVSDLTNDAEYQTKTEVDSAINTAIGSVVQFGVSVVDRLPEEGQNDHTIYLVASETAGDKNAKTEYLYVNGAWEIIGETKVDLTAYSTTEQVQALINAATTPMTEQEVTAFNTELWGE